MATVDMTGDRFESAVTPEGLDMDVRRQVAEQRDARTV